MGTKNKNNEPGHRKDRTGVMNYGKVINPKDMAAAFFKTQ